MKRPILQQDLVPVQELRAELARWLQHVADTGRPVVVTQRGRAAAALVSTEALDEIEEGRALVKKTLRGLHDLEAGRVDDDDDVWAEVERVIGAAEKKRRARRVE